MIARRLAPLTLDSLSDLPMPCRACVFWHLDAVAADRAERDGDTAFEKEAWLSAALLEWGSVGRVAYVDSAPAGYLMYAPPHLVPRSVAFPTAPVSADAVLLMTGRVLPEFAGGGLGRMLLQGVAKDLTRRGVRAIEAYGVHGDADVTDPFERALGAGGCVLPADYLLSVGFKTVRPHHRNPRLRLDLRTALSWREDVEHALERLLGSVRAPVLTRG
ncbi:MAG TPA: GNAT family N-acetyltransferase [Actinomycetales bacterium]|jgi:GNAT superfamily N-acetyltransferase